jgi:hypothetical protein
MATKIEGAASGNIAEVDSSNQLKVALAASSPNAGFMAPAIEADAGLFTGSRLIREADISPDYRTRVGIDSILMHEYFAGTNTNTSIWGLPIATATTAQGGGFLTLNNSGSLTATQGGILRSHRTFPIYSSIPTYFDFLVNVPATSLPFNNAIAEFGAGLIGVAPATGSTDGALFRITATGILCVIANNGAEVTTVTLTTAQLAAIGVVVTNTNHYLISITEDQAEFWIAPPGGYEILVAKIARGASAIAITTSQQLGVFGRVYNTGTNTQNALKLNIAMTAVSIGDAVMDVPFSHRMSAAGNMALQTQSGISSARTCSWNTWAALPGAFTPTNSTYPGTAGLGGIARTGPTLTFTADTAYIIFSYQVPALTVVVPIVPAKILVLTGLKISACTRAATGPATILTFVYSLMVGCNNVNPATAENAATPVKVARPVVLGMSTAPASAVAGTMLTPDVQVMFDSPITYYPGEYIQVTATPMVTYVQSSSQEFVFSCTPIGYWK